MSTLLILGLMFFGAIFSLVLIPLVLIKMVFGLLIAIFVIPFKILGAIFGGLARVLVKGMFWLALLLIPLAIIAFPVTIVAFGAWLVYRAFNPRRPPQAYVVG
jgi:hypothetical protein